MSRPDPAAQGALDAPWAPGVAHEGFLADLVAQLRADDTYGRFDRLADEALLRPYLTGRDRQGEVAGACAGDPAAESRIRAYFQAVAAGVEKGSGVITTTILDLSDEGFGLVVILAGRLVILREVLRDAQRFGFPSLERLAERGSRLATAAMKVFCAYPEVARDDS